jgi:myo-inositol-1(or 4)-monophosphatase
MPASVLAGRTVAAVPPDARDELLALATDLATRAAELLVDGLGRTRAVVDTKSSPTDMVTEMDEASEVLIVEGIAAARPEDAIVAEEGTAVAGGTGVRWVVDPLDGTTNYLYGLPGFAVSIAVEIDAVAEVAAVCDPLHRDLFTAVRGRGAWRNGEPIHASVQSDLSRALIGTGFSYDPERRARQAAVLATVLPRVRDIRRYGAASIDLCWVGAGRLDGYYERGLAPWDYSGGALVAREAGALTEDLDGSPPSWDFTLAAGPALFESLRALLAGTDARNA